ncbi:MAG: ribosome recycling factor [Candidatus Buchananbacteria bacterium]
MQIIEQSKPDFEKSIDVLKSELATLRIGRANPAMVEGIIVDAYGSKMPIKQMASIAVPEARTILIQPWDKTLSKEIEKAIIQANIGINPVNEGQQVRLTIPQLTEENRKDLVKSVKEKMEKARITIRQIRDKVRDSASKMEKEKEITEDDKFSIQKKLDEVSKEYTQKVDELGEKKENEIMTI